MDTIAGHNLPEEGELRNADVFYLYIPETVKTLLVGIIEHSKGIKETERGLGAKLVLEGIQGGGGLVHLGWGEDDGRSSKEGGNIKLHINVLNG